ncbi:hypothetical protein [Haloferula sargassicola]
MRPLLVLLLAAFTLPLVSCMKDPDLDPQPKTPPTSSSQLPFNRPISGQGGGQMSAMPMEPRR